MSVAEWIIRKGEGWVALNKPAGMLVEDNPWEPDNLENLLRDYLAKSRKKPFVGIVHRLDRVTSGIILMATKKQTLKALNEQFREKNIRKLYRARVEGIPNPPEATLRHWLEIDQQQKKAMVHQSPHPKTKEAVLHYKTVSVEANSTLLEIELMTGRFHQIRAQLAAIGHPVAGDSKYHATTVFYNPKGIALQAFELSFTDPATQQAVTIRLPQTEGF